MFTGKGYALQWLFPQAPVLADLARAKGQVRAAHGRVGAVAADFIAGERATGLWIKRVQTDQYLIDHLLVAESLHHPGVVAGQVDDHVGTALQGRFDPHHAQAGVAVNFARHARLAVPDRGLELEHDLVAPAVVGALDRALMLGVQGRGQLDLVQRPQRHRQHHVIRLVANGANFDGYTVLVLGDSRHGRTGLDGFQLLDERLGQYRTAAEQARGPPVAVGDAAIDAVLLGEIQQRQARRFVIPGANLLVHQLPRRGRQLQAVEPVGHGDLVQRMQRAGRRRVQRVFDGARQVVQGGFVALEGFGGGRLFARQVRGGEVDAVDQVAGGAHELRGRRGAQLEGGDVLVQHWLRLLVADPLAGGHARTTAQARFGFQQRHGPAFVLQFIGRREPRQAAADDDGRRLFVLGQRRNAEQPYHHQRTGAQPTSRHSTNSGLNVGNFSFRASRLRERRRIRQPSKRRQRRLSPRSK
nr:hypothetical protein [Pseudomonas kilonensis]